MLTSFVYLGTGLVCLAICVNFKWINFEISNNALNARSTDNQNNPTCFRFQFHFVLHYSNTRFVHRTEARWKKSK